jgi:hypothetical protein
MVGLSRNLMMVIPLGKALRMTMALKQTGQPSFLEALLPKGAGANATRDRLAIWVSDSSM